MWVPRSSDDIANWKRGAEKDARLSALIFGVGIWIGISALLAGGWVASAQGIAAQSFLSGGFWLRFLFLTAAGSPFAIWTYRREKRKHLDNAQAITVCPECDTAGEYNEGNKCNCGGTFVLQSTVRWVEDDEGK